MSDEEIDMGLLTLRDQVVDEESFIAFISALACDRIDEVEKEQKAPSRPFGPGANGRENSSIEGFLEALVAWAQASRGWASLYSEEGIVRIWC